MTEDGFYTYHEITNQPSAWANALQVVQTNRQDLTRLWHSVSFERLIFTGCGSTYYLSLAAASLTRELTGLPADALPASELWLYPKSNFLAGQTLFVAVSRSGSTTETIRAVEAFRQFGQGRVLVITNYGSSPLAALGDEVIVIPEGQEESVAQTRSFASMFVAASALSALLGGHLHLLDSMQALPSLGARLLEKYADLARERGADLSLDRFYFLGSGPRYGLASEANLKMKEMSLTHSEPFHFLEFRHGPMSMVTKTSQVVGLLSQVNQHYEQAVLTEMEQRGAHVLSLGENTAHVAFESGLPEAIRNVLYLPVLQLMAYHRSMSKGLNPDRPLNLTAVVHLDI